MKIKIRKAKISDIPQLVDLLVDFYRIQRDKGVKTITEDDAVLKGGVTIEVGNGFANPAWMCVIADRAGSLVSCMIGVLEFCTPISKDLKCVKVLVNYLTDDSLVGPRVLSGVWKLMEEWASEHGAGFFYANIHPGNASSIRAAKHVGFKHQYTQFYKELTLEA